MTIVSRRRMGWGLGLLVTTCGWLGVIGCNNRSAAPPMPNMSRALVLREALSGDAGSAASAVEEVVVSQPTGWATLKGRFVLSGTAPPAPKLTVTGTDAEVCAPGGKSVYSEEVVVGPNGGIRNILIFLSGDLPGDGEPWIHPSAQPGQGGEVEFDQKECTFLTHVLAMQTGQTLKILNSDPIGHNTKLEGTPLNQIVSSGSYITYVPGDQVRAPISVSCSIHPWMSAYILVRDNGYFAVTDEQGNFEIPNLPAGVELELRIWHEKTKFLSKVDVGGQTVQKGRLKLNLEPGEADLSATLDATLFQ